MFLYYSKKVIILVNNQPSNLSLFISDSCECCDTSSITTTFQDVVGALGLDFSYKVLNELLGEAAYIANYINILWEIIDKTLYNFDNTSLGYIQGPILDAAFSSQTSSLTILFISLTLVTSIVIIFI